MRGRAASVSHAEYEILRVITDEIDLRELRDSMCPDKVSRERFDKALRTVGGLIQNMMDRRAHKLPKNHVDYRTKGSKK